jgi:BlaI family penicillinase repressor
MRSVMDAPKISESEWAVMEVLWDNSPRTASEVAKNLRETTSWAENTVRTLLTRLVEKGALEVQDPAGSSKLYSPAMNREACVRAESESFLGRIFQGAAQPLLVHFAKNARLTPEEVRELKRILDQSTDNTNRTPKQKPKP